MISLRSLAPVALLLATPFAAMAATPSAASPAANGGPATLVEKVRAATASFRDINVALAEGFVQGTPCVSGPDFGAMGVHYVLPARIAAGTLSADQPEALIYEPLAGGGFRLVGVEFIVIAATWASAHPSGSPPALEGHLLNLIDAPNRFGLPAFYELHVWAWEENPVGSFADWNTHVTCVHQPAS